MLPEEFRHGQIHQHSYRYIRLLGMAGLTAPRSPTLPSALAACTADIIPPALPSIPTLPVTQHKKAPNRIHQMQHDQLHAAAGLDFYATVTMDAAMFDS